MSTPEGAVKKKVVKILKAYGVYYFFPAMGLYGRAGVADILGCAWGQFFAIECKAGNNVATALQLAQGEKVTAAGGKFFIVNEATLELIELWLQHQRKKNGRNT